MAYVVVRRTNGDIAHKEAGRQTGRPTASREPGGTCGSSRAETAFISPSHDPSRFRLKLGRLGSSLSRFYLGLLAAERAGRHVIALLVAVVSLDPSAHTNSEIRAISTQLPPDLVCRKMHSDDDNRPTETARARVKESTV